MIAYLFGSARFVHEGFLVLDVHGVGYKVHGTSRTLEYARTNTEISLHVHTVVREDALELFGFVTHEELELFKLLIGISGIGPRSALGIIGLESVETLISAIAHGDIGYLTKVSGVGKKSAEKIVLELRDKVSRMRGGDMKPVHNEDSDVLEALQALGYRADDAREALKMLPEGTLGQNERIREALRMLSRT